MSTEDNIFGHPGLSEMASYSWLAAIIHSSDDAIISKTLDGIVSSWNEGARRIFGYTAEEMIGQPILKLIPQDRWGEEPAILERLKRGERVDHFETKRISKEGVLLDISLSISPIRDRNGKIIGASKIARNITDQKRAREIAELNERLAQSNHELEQFAYIASHDLQEPLRKIHVFSELLEEQMLQGADISKLTGYLNKIKNSSSRMSRLIKDVLEYSRLSRPEGSFAEVDLNQVIREVLHEFELMIAEKRAVIDISPLPVICGIGSQFHQLFRNLISNALKFSREKPRISIRAEGKHIIVQDNGIGFDQGLAPKVFEIFQRLNSQDVYGGSGIGLALCKKIVENHGGVLSVQSEPGKGSTFHIDLSAV